MGSTEEEGEAAGGKAILNFVKKILFLKFDSSKRFRQNFQSKPLIAILFPNKHPGPSGRDKHYAISSRKGLPPFIRKYSIIFTEGI